MHRAALVLAAGADFRLLGPRASEIASLGPGHRRLLGPDRRRQEPDQPRDRADPARARPPRRPGPPPDALPRPRGDRRAALRHARRHRRLEPDDRGARGVRAPVAAGMLVYAGVDYEAILRSPERGRRDHLGRRQQRFPVLARRPADRRRRPAASRRRARLPPGRGEPADGRRGRRSTSSTAPRRSSSPGSGPRSPGPTRRRPWSRPSRR